MPEVFSANPLSLSVPDGAFETWLRDTGYLEVLDERSSSSAHSPPPLPSSSTTQPPNTTSPASSSTPSANASSSNRPCGAAAIRRVGASAVTSLRTIFAILTLNPFAKLTAGDFGGETPSWTVGFISSGAAVHSSYSWPGDPARARMRVHENVKRYARNYAALALLFLACSLYHMPMSLVGLLTCLGLWEGLNMCSARWKLPERSPTLRHLLVVIFQFGTAMVLFYCNLQKAVLCAMVSGYAVMITHASLRKLSASKPSTASTRYSRPQMKRHWS